MTMTFCDAFNLLVHFSISLVPLQQNKTRVEHVAGTVTIWEHDISKIQVQALLASQSVTI